MANIKSIGGNPIVVPSTGIEDGAVTAPKLASDVVNILGLTEISFVSGYISTSSTPIDLGTVTPSNDWRCAVVECVAGDVFEVTGRGVLIPRLYAFTDASGNVVKLGDGNMNVSDLLLIAPTGAQRLVINDMLKTGHCYKGIYANDIYAQGIETNTALYALRSGVLEKANLFDKNKATAGHYVIAANGKLDASSAFTASDYVNVAGLSEVTLSYTHIACWYDKAKNYISAVSVMNTINADATVAVPEGAAYIRASTQNGNVNVMQIGVGIARDSYIAYGKMYANALSSGSSDETIVVAADGSGDYTSFTRAMYETLSTSQNVIVKQGTYDIKQEYIDLFGQSVVDSLSDSTAGIFEFQYGVRIRNRRVEFEAGAHLVCDWTGKTVDATHRFCPLRVEYGAEIVGLDLDCTHTFYAIHDDYGTPDNSPYTIKYDKCRIIGHNLVNHNCIGGGCHACSRHVLTNCYVSNGTTYAAARYHNTNFASAEPEVYVDNCYFNSSINFTYYGSQTTKMRAYVNNCYAPNGIIKMAESSSYSVDNVEIYKWCNVESA